MNFVTECLDSKLIPLGCETTEEAIDCLLRLRLHFLIRILLKDTIIVPQGWALDSISFFAIGSEIQRALDELKRGKFENRPIATSAPFKMELHIPGANYTDVLASYLRRNDCHWSGLPILRDNRDARAHLLEQITQSTRTRRFDLDHFASAAKHVLDNNTVASAWSDVMQYFLAEPTDRIIRVQWDTNYYKNNLQQGLTALDNWEGRDETTNEAVVQLRRFKTSAEKHPDLLATVSSLLSHVSTEYDESARRALQHISNFSQVHAVAQATQSSSSADSISYLSHNGVLLGDRILRESFSECRPTGLFVEQNLTGIPQLALLLKNANWAEVWTNVLLLAQDAKWNEIVAELKRAKASYDDKGAKAAFAKMENMLSKACPALALEMTGVERMGLKLTDAGWSKIFGKAVAVGVGSVVATALIDVPIAAAAAAVVAGWVGEAFLAPRFDPFKGGTLASRATVFRLVR